ncbi:MAG: glutamine synthetase family protein [Acidimicrobiales bacterium]
MDYLREQVKEGSIDTVIVAMTDMQGRLVGKKLNAPFFVENVAYEGTDGCNYLLAVDVDMRPASGYAMSSWERGYGDFVMKPDLATLRMVPWQTKTALVLSDVVWPDGTEVVASPRQILRKQLDRLGGLGLDAYCGTELEFLVFNDTYEVAWKKGYRDLEPANLYNVDYSLLGVSRVEALLRDIRISMAGAAMTVESVKGECNLGQHEIAFRYDHALRTCDNHVIYKLGAKEIAAQHGKSLTFMAKFNEAEGSSCHTHLSLRDQNGGLVFVDPERPSELSTLGQQFLAGQLDHVSEMTLMFAPNINSYKRFVEGSFAPTAIAWGRDNRTCALRLVGSGAGLRFENRVPGGDANPYLVVAAMVAAGLDGIERGLELPPPESGNAYHGEHERIPSSLADALATWKHSPFIAEAFGDEVRDHYATMGSVELEVFARAITDWERFRSFERM